MNGLLWIFLVTVQATQPQEKNLWLTFLSDLASGSLAGILGGAIGGSIGGVTVLLVQRILRRRGTIEASHKRRASSVQYLQAGSQAPNKTVADEIHYRFTLYFFNRKPSDSGLRDLEVVFSDGDRLELRDKPNDRDKPEYQRGSAVPIGYEEIDVLALPAGQIVTLRFSGELKGGDAEKARNCDQVQIQGYLFGEKKVWRRKLDWT